jgi:hypothetical protein
VIQSECDQSTILELVRKCTKCFRTKAIEDFYKKGNRRDSICKDCVSKLKRASYRANTKREEKVILDAGQFSAAVIGKPNRSIIDSFSAVLVESIQGLIDEGKI